jgi:hypothetical protein
VTDKLIAQGFQLSGKTNERIRAVKKYFLNRKYSVPSTELFRIGETDDQPNS